MNTNNVKPGIWVLALVVLSFGACKKENITVTETITTVVVNLTTPDGSFNKEFIWDDRDGDGGNAPVIDEIVLPQNKAINCRVHFYDKSKTPEVDITEEVEQENAAHLLVFSVSGANLTITSADTDDNGKPFRLQTVWTTTGVSNGTVKITLRHEPDKNSVNPDITGDVDAEVEFPVKIQ